jgi:hypothetical protein
MTTVLFAAFAFILAGFVKGVSGMGLPTVSIGLLGLIMAPADAAALLVIPSLITNVWQFTAMPGRAQAVRRLWPMLIAVCVTTIPAVKLFSDIPRARAALALGAILALYALLGLAKMHPRVARRHEPWLGPVIGAMTGAVAGATGVFVMPGVPYMQALEMERDELVQALGLSFTVSTIALAIGLALAGHLQVASMTNSLLCTVPAFIGMAAGQWLRVRISPATFRTVFFAGMLVLGLDLIARGL